MCGIVGYVGKNDCSEVLVSALSRLEYRGYDSAGIAVFENGNINVIKAEGRLKNLENKMENENFPKGSAGIGHTRWATHGKPSDINSHPHIGGEYVTLVHNGIIENYRELKEKLEAQGREFYSETDTEVVAKLLDFNYEGDPIKAIEKTLAEVTGSFALGILFKDIPNVIYAVRRGSPLIVGVKDEEGFIASDVPAIIKYTKDYYLLEHDEIAKIAEGSITFTDLKGNPIDKELKTADWDMDAAEKGGYEHYMLKEINEQPDAVRKTVAPRVFHGMPSLEECSITLENLKDIKQVFIVACGTAMHAGMVGKYAIEKLARVPVNVDIASEFRYRSPLVGEGDLVIIISQSGETADSLEALRVSKALGAKVMGVVNAKGSSIARESDMLVYTHAGPEIAVASTKAYMVQIAVMYMLSFELAFAKGRIDEGECKRLTAELMAMPERIAEIIKSTDEISHEAAKCLIDAESLLYIGRGFDYALSMEGSLKLKEISYIHSECYAAGELKHGTISLITDGMPVIAVATQSDLFDKTISNIKEVKARGAKVLLICGDGFEVGEDVADMVIRVPMYEEMLMPMAAIVPLQLVAYYSSVLRGNDVDKPRNLAKSVTVE
ncbi:MAG: glutamine--fructose-6-phosphate transaminase (isomerizing) [Ruminococcaceae bacterium]|nr:glutamine--fructose-6-phosphate transaminase (isomerizing) [Oscillospiraceae bacterium]